MTDNIQSPYKPMYKVKPYFSIRKVKLPDCMYMVQPLHKLPALTSDDLDYQRALGSLEERQENIFSRIKELQDAVVNAGKAVGLTKEELQRLTETYIPEDTPLDVVITTPPSSPPYSILALYHYIKKNISTCLKSFVHSSATGRVSPELANMFTSCTMDNPKLKITVIWKEDNHTPEPAMVFTPNKQVPISGIANICRFLSRQFCPEIYESLEPVQSSQADTWLDTLSLSYIHGNSKEKGSVLRQLNSALGSKEFLIGPSLTLGDVVVYCVLGNEKNLKIANNVKKWMKRCHSVPELVTVPCLYLDDS